MDNIIATWVCIDNKANGTYFPSSKGSSADAKVQNIYWRCISCFYTLARLYNTTAKLVLFSNSEALPIVDGTDIKAILDKLNVAFYTTPFEFVTPEGYYNQWRNQFYEFSILKFISNHPDFNTDDRFLLLDSDCIITRDLNDLFTEISAKRCITYVIDYDVKHVINGNSRNDMKSIFEVLLNKRLDHIPQYHAGEIFGATIEFASVLVNDFLKIWQQLLTLNAAGLPKLNEEAHVLSFLFYKNDITGGDGNQYIKRLWTDPTTFRNIEKNDENLHIWHLPAEKRHGFKVLFEWLQKVDFTLRKDNSSQIKNRLQNIFLIPVIPLQRRPFFAGKYLYKKVFTSS